ncbi:MAG: putative polynucleotide adenylyltransferase [Pseudomonadota bacterium]|jgi:poly(A) polymerase
MIKKFIDKLLEKASTIRPKKPKLGKREEFGFTAHQIDPSLVDERAAHVVHTLKAGGFQAYVVGGAVRDLLLGLKPKDFDVATNATPEQVKALFRRAFIIGRRFRIVHVVFGRGRQDRGLSEVIEVSTFRALLDSADASQVKGNERSSKSELAGMTHAVDGSGRVLRDNVWGSQEEDAARRDFTVNAMYYDPEAQLVVDYHGGIKDARKKTLRMIGDPATRYREDPVRIIRAVRFGAKLSALGFRFDAKTSAPLVEMKALLADVPQSRLFDEMLKLLQTGHAVATVAQLTALGLGRGIYPLLDLVVERAGHDFVRAALVDTDRRVGEGKPVAPSFLLACVLWADVRDGWAARLADGQHGFQALQDAIDDVFNARIGDVSGRGKLAADMRDIWMMQPRFDKRAGSGPFSMVEQPRFRAGFDFLRLRASAGEVGAELAAWWEDFSMADDAQREALLRDVREATQAPRRQPRPARVHRVPADGPVDAAPAIAPPANPEMDEAIDPGATDAPKKRRRRRRKPGAGGATTSPADGD